MARFLVDLARAVVVAPDVQQPLVHGPWSELGDLAEIAECRELCVCDAHVGLVGLDVGRCDGFELGGWGRVKELVEDGKFEGVARPGDEFLQVDFADGADGVELESVNIFVPIECMYGRGRTSALLASYLVKYPRRLFKLVYCIRE